MRFGPRVLETTTTTGTGDYALAGAVAGHQTFVAGVIGGVGANVYAFVTDGNDWEELTGALSAGPDTLTRNVMSSSNGGSPVNWGAGTKYIYSAPPAVLFHGLGAAFKGSARPAWARAGFMYPNDSSGVVQKYYDGTDEIPLWKIDEANNRALFELVRGTAIASASSIDIGAATGDFVHITGTTTITALGTAAAGVERTLVFDGSLTLTHNATSLILQAGGANITTAAGDSVVMRSEGSGNWKMVGGVRASGAAWVAPGAASTSAAGIVELATSPETVTGTDTARATTPAGVAAAIAAALAASAGVGKVGVTFQMNGTIDKSMNVSSITDHGTGDFTVNFTNAMPDALYQVQVTADTGGSSGNDDRIGISVLRQTGSVRVRVISASGTTNESNVDRLMVNVFSDMAA